jgi:plastocyanin
VEEVKNETPVAPTPSNGKSFPVKGIVTFEGTPPENKKLTLPAGCGNKSGAEARSNEILIHNGKLENVLITIKNPPPSNEPVPTTELVLDQHGCMYHPRIAAARVGQKVTFVNSDAVFHNVRSITSQNEKFNMAMPRKDQRITKTFMRPEMFLQAKCSVHPWMGAYVAVMDHPWFSVTNEKGEFHLPKLPVGKYQIEAWHEVFGTETQEIEISDAGAQDVNFTFKGKP